LQDSKVEKRETYFYKLFDRRINRSTYLTGEFLNILFLLTLAFIIFINIESDVNYIPVNLKIVLVSIVFFVESLIQYSLTTRRWHDVGENGWYLLVPLTFTQGEKEENKYGKPPAPGIDLKGLFGF
jgi:uncharacterized membrane protein YhaH (DUF805 family)